MSAKTEQRELKFSVIFFFGKLDPFLTLKYIFWGDLVTHIQLELSPVPTRPAVTQIQINTHTLYYLNYLA